ncbi:MAG: CaiB/BaiF CoA transferase family protein, partial [Candidatus Limnocylindria bacterium]
MSSTDESLPLSGIRVLDCSRVLAGPFATMLLADLGADVTKLEPPGGDEARTWGPPWWGPQEDRRSAYFASINRNKRSVVVDLRTGGGRAVLDRLAAHSDLLVHNARPASAKRLGLDPERLRRSHPSLVVAAIGGFAGVDADRPAYDLLAQAVSGLMAVTGEPDHGPMKTGVAVVDLLTGLEVAVGALAALVGRQRRPDRMTAHVEVNLIEAGVTALANVLANHLATGDLPRRWGNQHPNIVPYQGFATADGHVVVAVGNDTQFGRLLSVLGLDPDDRYATNPRRLAHRAELVAWLSAAFLGRRRDEVVLALRAADVPAGPVSSVPEAIEGLDAALGGRWTQRLDGMAMAPGPIRLDGRLLPLGGAPPRLGEHTNEVLAEVGYTPDQVARLRTAG